jgi:hypothetical protein
MQVIPLKYQTIPEPFLKKVCKNFAAVCKPFPLHIDLISSVPQPTLIADLLHHTSPSHIIEPSWLDHNSNGAQHENEVNIQNVI